MSGLQLLPASCCLDQAVCRRVGTVCTVVTCHPAGLLGTGKERRLSVPGMVENRVLMVAVLT